MITKSLMVKVNIVVEEKQWKKNNKKIEFFLKKITKKIVYQLFPNSNSALEISILLTHTKGMRNLNYKFRKINKDTDVLSFPAQEKKFFKNNKKIKENIYLGDVALSFGHINHEIKNSILDFNNYLKKMIIHAVLHLVGYEHDNDKNYKKMNALENKIIKNLK